MKVLISILVIVATITVAWLLTKNSTGKSNLGDLRAGPDIDIKTGELKTEDLKVGQGREAKGGEAVTVHYVGTLTDGNKFDSSRDRGEPFSFNLGAGEVIEGWDKGVVGMKEGGLRKLTIPPQMGYPYGAGSIPANSTLIFEVELIKVGDSQ